MANPHIATARAIGKDIHEKGWTIKKGWLIHEALKRARRHRSKKSAR